MNEIIKLVIKYKGTRKEKIFNELVEALSKYILFYLKKVPVTYKRETLHEMLIIIFNTSLKYEHNYNFILKEDSFSIENYLILEKTNYKKVNQVMNNNYIDCFIKIYGYDMLKKSFFDSEIRKKFIYENFLFNNENRLINYLKKQFQYVYINLLKEETKIQYLHMEENYLFNVSYRQEKIDVKEILKEKNLKEREIKFLLSFINNDKLLSEEEVAKKLGVSQQAINKRKKRIIKKIIG